MFYKIAIFLVALSAVYCSSATVLTQSLKSDPVGPVVIHATTNSSVPSVDYIVNAVQCLKQAIEVFPDEANTAKMYAALMGTKYPDQTWNVAVGYTTLYLDSTVYVECSVSSGGKQLKDDKKGTVYMVFGTKK